MTQVEEYYSIKGEHDVLNKEISQKDIETELLRLDQYHFNIEFNNFKGPTSGEMTLIKDNTKKTVKVERAVLQST